MALQIRRGLAADRGSITPVIGEPIYITDTNQLVIGDGVTAGGITLNPTASATVLGGIKVGAGLSIDGSGVLTAAASAPYTLPISSATTLGGIKIGAGLSIDVNGVVTAPLPISSATTLGGIKIGSGLSIDGNGVVTASSGGSGTVTSVGLSMPGMFTVTNSPVTASGTLTASLASQSVKTVLAAPNASAGVPSFRQLALSDLSDGNGVSNAVTVLTGITDISFMSFYVDSGTIYLNNGTSTGFGTSSGDFSVTDMGVGWFEFTKLGSPINYAHHPVFFGVPSAQINTSTGAEIADGHMYMAKQLSDYNPAVFGIKHKTNSGVAFDPAVVSFGLMYGSY